MKLYSYWRSTTSYRVRAALNLKEIPFETVPVNLVEGEQNAPGYKAINPAQGVPTLILDDGTVLTQSMAILEYLEAVYPDPPLLPADPVQAARVRAAAMGIACDVHPVNNLKVGQRLKSMGHSQQEVVAWMKDWMARGFAAFEQQLDGAGPFAFGDQPGLADLCLIPQLYNAHRWGLDVTAYPGLARIETNALKVPAIAAAHPDRQPDAQPA
ncbi:maleylacetoacetate isomerase [Roseobacter sp. YSTF-M11]|uniref:Maleylacetoacetate isomerase n=1 Tax=Roseobacter insulae TaxID=2859783 RepID=A0A9X1FY97_9RHOB|nr:maleylacetoacetate isomerase [Roseobacter insulae]MBW4709974.1 maleylacetoacetate isomerase [Roseobacter insulae]